MNTGTLTWKEVCAIPWLKDIPAKIEIDKHSKIMVSPLAVLQGGTQCGIGLALDQRLKDGRCLMSCPIDTSDGTHVADVAWMSKDRFLPHRPRDLASHLVSPLLLQSAHTSRREGLLARPASSVVRRL